MNGAESLVRTMVNAGVDVCFTNPGTSEMHFVAALDKVEGMRCVLGLFEGAVTGMADGFARMADKPASTLLHLGPGLANGLANLHNAKRAFTPIVNIVGDHATYHHQYDAPLTADIEGFAKPVSGWIKTSPTAKDVAADGAEAIAASLGANGGPVGQIATLILPANTAWDPSDGPAQALPHPVYPKASKDDVVEAAKLLTSGDETVILLSGNALREENLALAGKIQKKTGCRLMAAGNNGRWQKGAGRVQVERVQYVVDVALAQMENVKNMILIGAKQPVAFFAYPNKPSVLTPEGCNIHELANISMDLGDALTSLTEELGAMNEVLAVANAPKPELMTGELNPVSISAALGHLMPENAIIADESVSSGRGFMPNTANAAPHDWLSICGGAIGLGIPYATGAAIACPDRKVICLEGDGSGMYTMQALWTQARESANVVNIIFANRTYAILKGELMKVGAENPGRKAMDMLEIGRPDIDWVGLATSLGVSATQATTAEEFNDQLARAINEPGPQLIEAVIP